MTSRSNSRDAGPGRRDAGFSLIETMMALVLIALVAAIALPWAPLGRVPLGAEAARVAAVLRADRDAAIRRGTPVATQVDLDAPALVSGSTGGRIALPRGVALSVTAADPRRIAFAPDGSAGAATLVLAAQGRTIGVDVSAFTGTVAVRGP